MDLYIPPNEFENSEKSIAEPTKKSTLFFKNVWGSFIRACCGESVALNEFGVLDSETLIMLLG